MTLETLFCAVSKISGKVLIFTLKTPVILPLYIQRFFQ